MFTASHSFLITMALCLSVFFFGFTQQSCPVKKDQYAAFQNECLSFYKNAHVNKQKSDMVRVTETGLQDEAKKDRELCQSYCEVSYKGNDDFIYACRHGQHFFFKDYQRVLIEHWKRLHAYKTQKELGFTPSPPAGADDDAIPGASDDQKESDPLLNLVPRIKGPEAMKRECKDLADQSPPGKDTIGIAGACETGFTEESNRANQFLPYWPEGKDTPGGRESGSGSPK